MSRLRSCRQYEFLIIVDFGFSFIPAYQTLSVIGAEKGK